MTSLFRACCVLSFAFGALLLVSGCDKAPQQEVALYTSVDEPYARPIVQAFEKETGIKVRLVTDTEATKSVGLAERLRAEKSNPHADVWWGNEPLHTINLAEEGVLASYASPSAQGIPEKFRDPQHRWAGCGLRARVICSGTTSGPRAPTGLEDLLKPVYKNSIALARPTAGTTGTHVAAIYVLWGDEKATKFFKDLQKHGVKLLGGNGAVAEQVAQGAMIAGLTDNDDVRAVLRGGGSLTMTLPDQTSFGTLAVPTTVALVTGAKNADSAKKLIDYLLTAKVEQELISAQFAGWSVRESKDQPKWMDIDYREVAKTMPAAVRKATAILEGRE
jgi:iron(III) transport system substrate-binding protein